MIGIILSNWRYKVNENIPPGGIFAAKYSFNLYDAGMKIVLHHSKMIGLELANNCYIYITRSCAL
jgi:hypothetical protein